MSISARLALIPQLFHKGTNNMCQKNLFCLISLVLLAVLVISPAKATYTDYIGAGHDTDVVASASSVDEEAVGQNTVNGSGLTGNSHSTDWADTWCSAFGYHPAPSPNPARGNSVWIYYDLGHVYQLAVMHVWNYNEDGYTARGCRNVTIDYSVDGSSWSELDTYIWPEAPGSSSYTGFDGPDFGGASARYVLITVNSNFPGDDGAYGLSEIKINISTGPADTDPPTPNPATWASPPAATSPYTIEMTATTATDPSGVQYFFDETTSGSTHDSDWQSSSYYPDSSLSPSTQYTYRTRSRDQSVNNNLTDWSTPPASATTNPEDLTPPTPNPATWSSPPSADDPWQISMTATTATDPCGVQYFFDETTSGSMHDSFWQASPDYTNYGLTPETQYTYQVKARDQSANRNQTNWSTPPASATTDEIPSGECPDVDLDDDCDCDIDDLVIFVGQWLDNPPCVGIGDPNGCADLDEENDNVDNEDFTILAADWQEEGGFVIPTNLVINEIMSNNDTTHPDPADGEYQDWIEIYNEGPTTINMAGMFLADDGNIWQIPSGVTINTGQYRLFWADGQTSQGIYHTNFALSASGDSVTLYDTDGETILDTVSFGELSDDISYGRWLNITGDFMNMDAPTPEAENTVGMAGEVYFSRPGGTFMSNFNLGLTTKSPTAQIYYTKNGDEPTNIVSGTNLLYSPPFSVTSTTWVRARAYDSGLDPSPITSKAYLKLHSNIYNFQTNLPIVVIDTFNVDLDDPFLIEEEPRDFYPVIATFIDTDEVTGNAIIAGPADWSGLGGMHVRGASSAGYDKKQYRFETWDENNPDPDPGAQYRDMDVSLLGMPADSDWIIHAPWSDKTLMRNYQIYTWSRQIGRYAVRCRFVELFLDKDDGNNIVSSSDYWGVYVFMEKIKRDRNRIDLAELGPSDNAEPGITGGYVLDKGGEDLGWSTATYGGDISCVDPVWTELTSTQRTWIQDHFNEFEAGLDSGNYDNPAHANYYGNYIDIGSFVDHHIL
ncbi:MAG: CotH kinase family protein, partial [Planctomycetota bacterium]